MNNKVIVIGGGPSGLMAASQASLRGLDITLMERNTRCARKLLITGKGRCNITNATFDISELIANIPTNGRFLYSAFSSFMTYDTIDFFEKLGVQTKMERGNRIFPVSDKAVTVVDAMVNFAKKSGVKIIQSRALAFEYDNGNIISVIDEKGEKHMCDACIIATGGKSYPLTGSTGDGYKLALSAGHTVVEPRPSLVAMNVAEKWCSDLQGLALKNVAVKVLDKENKCVFDDFGEMLFTHFGVSGPIILSASAHIKGLGKEKFKLLIDLKPAISEQQLENRLLRIFQSNANKDFANSLGELLPRKIIPIIISLSGIEPNIKCNQITKQMRNELLHTLKQLTLTLSSFRDIDEAIITSGGVCVKEIEPKSMKSKIINNLYFAGEIIDVDGYTGGFNLQIAFSTGYLAGIKVLED